MKKQLRTAALMAAVVAMLAGCAGQTASEPSSGDSNGALESFELAMYTTNSSTEIAPYSGFELFQQAVEELSDGAASIRNAGGPEAIDPFEMGNVIGTGAIASAFAAAPYMLSRVPELSVFTYSPLSAQEIRDSEAWDVISDIIADKLNSHLLGVTLGHLNYNFYTKEEVTTLSEFEGMRMRSTAAYQPLLDKLGIEGIQMPASDIYSALERGLIDAYPQQEVGSVYPFGAEEFIKYKIGPGWWHGDVIILVDLDKWNSLTPEQQELLEAAAIQTENEQPAVLDDIKKEEAERLAGDGIEIIELEAAEGKELQKIAAGVGEDYIRANVPDTATQDALIEAFFPER